MSVFKFKQFVVNQDRCAMKIGTDSVLLGSWACVNNCPISILDIGAGTGVLSLMLAQRSQAQVIDALEIDNEAYEQCVENFEASIWSDRLFCYHASLEEFTEEIVDKYELIISNPPFYSEDYKSNNSKRDLARFTDAMPFNHLLFNVNKLLSENGMFCVIIPFKEETNFIALAKNFNLYLNSVLRVKGNPTSQFKRSLLTFSYEKTVLEQDILIIETSRHQFTEKYINLTKEFYLKM